MPTAPARWLSYALSLLYSFGNTASAQASFSPLRPPAVPLAVRNPYTSIWSSISTGGTALNSNMPIFWTGEPVGWEGMIAVDGVVYEYLGFAKGDPAAQLNYTSAMPLNVSFDSQSSVFNFQAGPVILEARFVSPVIPQDICRSSIPLSYVFIDVRTTDSQPHRIQFYSDVSSSLLVGDTKDSVSWELTKNGMATNSTPVPTSSAEDVYTWKFHRQNEVLFGESKEFPLWGNFTYTTSSVNASTFNFAHGEQNAVRGLFCENRFPANTTLPPPLPTQAVNSPVFAFVHDYGVVNETWVRYTIGSVQDPIIQYLNADGPQQLRPWWRNCYGDLHSMIQFHWDDHVNAQIGGDAFESQLRTDIDSFYEGKENPVNNSAPPPPPIPTSGTDQYGNPFVFDNGTDNGFLDPTTGIGIAPPFMSEAQSYYSIVALSASQTMGGYVFAVHPNPNITDPLGFIKEISSDGNINTVDVIYPTTPFFLYANQNLLRYALLPLIEYQEINLSNIESCIHDLGANFPNATGHPDGREEVMPLEESGNFLLMVYAYFKFTGDSHWISDHWPLLQKFAGYLMNSALIPNDQLATDDFAGPLQNQTSLAVKGILGLKAMSDLAGANNDSTYTMAVKSYYDQWEMLGIDPTGKHMMLAYQWRSSWGLLYNIYFDKLFNLGLVSDKIYTIQSDWYPTVSQLFGVPLDSRHPYTKTDWQVWAGATSHASTRRLFIDSIAYWLSEGTAEGPFTDLYVCTGTGAGTANKFNARPVVGGHYALLALGKTGQTAGTTGANTTGSLFLRDSAAALQSPTILQPASFGALTDDEKMGLQENVTTVISG